MSRKNKSHKKQENDSQSRVSQSVAALTANGLKAFRQNDILTAIQDWEKIPASLRPAHLLAEGYFRLGLGMFYGNDRQAGVNHLQTAAAYKPNDPCYAYHLGLAKHHLGDLAGAKTAYQAARQSGGPFAVRAAYPLALALLQSGEDPTTAPVWQQLKPTEQAMLRSVNGFRRRPYTLPADSPILWQALAELDAGNFARAQIGISHALINEGSAAEKALAFFYQGQIAAKSENWDVARQAWESALQLGASFPRLHSNLAELYHRRAEELLQQGDLQTAVIAAQEARRHRTDDNALDTLQAQIHQQLGYQAASANQWNEAQSHWQKAVELDSSSFRLAYNLALAYEKAEQYVLAGQTWREALRRRPRRADHPDALNDEQVARLWQRAAECYRKGSDFDEAERTYQQAIKWAPENFQLRMALAESLIANGRFQAGRNELDRLLERDPQNIPALLRLGEAYFRDEDCPWYVRFQARNCWEKVLEIDPQNVQARQMLGEWYFEQAESQYQGDFYAEACNYYLMSLEFRPNHIPALAYAAECYIKLKQPAKSEEYIQQALAQAKDLGDFSSILEVWFVQANYARAWETVRLAEERLGKIPAVFYIKQAHTVLEDRQIGEARRWLQRAEQNAAPQENIFVMIGEMAMQVDMSLATEYLLKAIKVGQAPGHASMLLGIIEAREGNRRVSSKYFAEAERIAKQNKDANLLEGIEMARMLSSAPEGLLRHLMGLKDSGLLEDFLEGLDEEFDDE